VLPASTMPDQIATALVRLDANDGVPDQNDPELIALDENIQALLPFPDVLSLLKDNDEWRAELEYAVTVQEGDVLDAIQAFRKTVQESGNLESGENITVTSDGPTILIQQADPQVVYVPVYEPAQVIVRQPEPVVTFAAAVVVGSFIWHGWGWGWGRPYYRSRYFARRNGGRWYRPRPGRPLLRPPYRPGRPMYRPNRPHRPISRPPQRPGGGRPGSGWRPNKPGNGRPPAGNRPGSGSPPQGGRPPTGNRPGSGFRPGGSKPSQRPSPGSRPSSRPAKSPGIGAGPSARPVNRPTARPGISSRDRASAFGGSSRGGRSSRAASSRGASSRGRPSRGSSRRKGR
jgi:hypothetical protein